MLDSYVRPLINPPLDFVGKKLTQLGVSSNAVTMAGFLSGLTSIYLISQSHFQEAVIMLILNRFLDGVDGAVARNSKLSDFGGFLDIVCDFIIYAGVVFAFSLHNPTYAFAAAFLIFSFIGPMSSFLAYAIIASKRGYTTEVRGKKSFYHLGGLCEGTETAFFLILMCLFPESFIIICYIFGTMCWVTTLGRIYTAWVDYN